MQQGAPDLDVGLGELLRPATLASARQGGLEPFHGALAVQIKEVLGHGAMHLQREVPVGRVAVELLGQAAEVDLLLPQAVDGTHHLDERATEAIELPHHEDVGRPEVSEGGLKLGTLGAGFPGLFLLEQAFATGACRSITLQVKVSIKGGDASISYKHVGILIQTRLIRNRNPVIFSRQKPACLRMLELGSARM